MSSLPLGDALRASNQCMMSLSQTKIPLRLFRSGGNGVKKFFSTYFQFTFKLWIWNIAVLNRTFPHSVTAAKLKTILSSQANALQLSFILVVQNIDLEFLVRKLR